MPPQRASRPEEAVKGARAIFLILGEISTEGGWTATTSIPLVFPPLPPPEMLSHPARMPEATNAATAMDILIFIMFSSDSAPPDVLPLLANRPRRYAAEMWTIQKPCG